MLFLFHFPEFFVSFLEAVEEYDYAVFIKNEENTIYISVP